ncbi:MULTISPECIES: Crp/Fnr family transcriptional regulator [unclassified Fusibacter]|uniref:Crp/Fnr family transcriptional regulator n=1 Tax=unclassified Fusibacter TaxID=2624464 RepID=UPI0010128243|nr:MULTISPECIES: Crp/Fnr family transcriptional regulator [unclassified Fusibacter]MCK8061109.1 Crp/Fnr family transcriptional regulator [Fusibacter sp. A2]NPE23355.1 Crp/Fnr family transcriptional regulator [Fusibacter sp. A1]RXV59400.1 Crp/Fnr family transcriptional regulator [Fusibacter sp. A1]
MKKSSEFNIHHGCVTCGHKLCAQKVSLFENLTHEQLGKVINLIDRKFYKKGSVIFSEGQPLSELYIVNSGSIKISVINQEGKEQILYILHDGQFIGDLTLLKSIDAAFTATALADTHVCTITNVSFWELLSSSKDILISTLAYAHDRINSLEKLVQAVSTNEADQRLLYLLDQLAESSGVQTKDGVVINLNIGREDMANFVGVSRETISRKLSQLSKKGKIELIDQKTIKLLY